MEGLPIVVNGEHCVVVGAGAAGLWTAWALTEVGMRVTVFDAGAAAAGASWGNAGWICPAQAGPVPEPGIIMHGLKDLTRRDSALHFSPAALLRLGPWIATFARYCNDRSYSDGLAALSTLGYPSFKLIERLGLDEHFDKTGLLTVSKNPADIEHFIEKIAPLAKFGQGATTEVLTGGAVQDLDPTVPRGQAAALIGNHWQIVPHAYMAALVEKVVAAGVEIREHEPVEHLHAQGGRVRAVRTNRGTYEADHVVLAAGVDTTALARSIGHPLPVIGGKGYSFDVRPGRMPRQAIQTLDTHLAISPMGGTLRVAGAMDFTNSPTRIPPRRVRAMRRSAQALLGPWTDESAAWSGLRPVAPDGLPMIGRLAPDSNVFAATGYQMLGMTISPAAGVHLAEAIASGDDGRTGPFSAQRFARGKTRKTMRAQEGSRDA
ncbi:FAD-dependent oxidoreductase [Streptomyces sp. NPDC003300]|uniref:NAD(P)/FAD-dependent oxidoreductase n=1 Tax=unclassified Streptomyces TaxID=2593676 RepID=UPI0033AEF60A